MRSDLVFESNQFNLSVVHTHFINPCCFGEDLAAWLSEQLRAQGFDPAPPAQEDWGWYFYVQIEGAQYLIGAGGNSNEDSADPNRGEWRIIIEEQRSLWQRLRGKRDEAGSVQLLAVIENLLRDQLGVSTIQYE